MYRGPFTHEQQVAAEQLLIQLFQLHVANARRKRVVEFAHVSKSGGTTFCQLGNRNGCRSESFSPNNNCLITEFRDQPRYVNGTVHMELVSGVKTNCDVPKKAMDLRLEISCGERRRRLLSRGYSIYANEYTAFGGRPDPRLAHACTNMLTVLQVDQVV
ncbi:hypothetical protein GPECTOR_14g139 [Gonium pectorale]|uniref:Uncharacterized protein n=1 Tax=Gonium pectorale TaxID=33097 RepID=A0A150GNH3_GONPE|nr:hypothetical protein GPECTOR_14g139 [Gonium pectorale]|eukprot:KXZ50890.1 hypothetical protein GPECTOR_14g139 [Gonium pectorale]